MRTYVIDGPKLFEFTEDTLSTPRTLCRTYKSMPLAPTSYPSMMTRTCFSISLRGSWRMKITCTSLHWTLSMFTITGLQRDDLILLTTPITLITSRRRDHSPLSLKRTRQLLPPTWNPYLKIITQPLGQSSATFTREWLRSVSKAQDPLTRCEPHQGGDFGPWGGDDGLIMDVYQPREGLCLVFF